MFGLQNEAYKNKKIKHQVWYKLTKQAAKVCRSEARHLYAVISSSLTSYQCDHRP